MGIMRKMMEIDNEKRIKTLSILLKEFIKKENTRLISQTEFKRNLGNLTKNTGISERELREVIEPIIEELVAEMLAR